MKEALAFLALLACFPVFAQPKGETASPRRLVIHVSQHHEAETAGRGAGVSGQVVLGSTRRADAGARVWDTRSARSESAGQWVQTIDGGRAYIQVGYSVPVPLRQVVIGPGGAVVSEGFVYRDLGQGFYAEPRLNGDRVTVEISQQADGPGRHGAVASQRLSATVSGRLGEWIELGGTGSQGAGSGGNGWSRSTGEVRDARALWLMVEELK